MTDHDPVDPADVIEQAEDQKQQQAADARELFDWFAERQGEFYPNGAVIEVTDWSRDRAQQALIGLVDDTLDPVQMVRRDSGPVVGIIDFEIFEDGGGYGFEEYDDTFGVRKNVVCGRCVENHDYAAEPFRAVEGVGRHDVGVGYDALLNHLTEHYANEHTQGPSSVDVAASLVSGTTIAGNTAVHGGNQGSFPVTGFGTGTVGDGQAVGNSGGSLAGISTATATVVASGTVDTGENRGEAYWSFDSITIGRLGTGGGDGSTVYTHGNDGTERFVRIGKNTDTEYTYEILEP